MPKTRSDVISAALRRIGVLAADEAAEADAEAYAGEALDALFAEVKQVHAMPFTWTLEETPDAAFLPMAYLLATEIAPHYERPSEPRSRAMGRLRAYAFPDDRDLRADYDEDGTVSVDEQDAYDRAAYY